MNEQEKRRTDFLGGVPVVLADGQTWYVPKPRVRFTPDDADGYRVHLSTGPGDDYQALVDAFNRASEEHRDYQERLGAWRDRAEAAKAAGPATGDAGPPPDPPATSPMACELRLCAALLRRNYDLTAAELAELVQFGVDAESDPDGVRIRDELTDIAFGVGPKPQAATSD